MKWEYRTLDFNKGTKFETPEYQYDSRLNKYGDDGWRLVAVDNGIAFFERPLRTKLEAEILAHFDYPQQDRSSEV